MAIGPEEYFFLQPPLPPVRRKIAIRHADNNLNLTDTDFTAYHKSLFAVWMESPPSRVLSQVRKLWRFRGRNADPGALQGGIERGTEAAVNEWADGTPAYVAAKWHDRLTWRNKSHLSDLVHEISLIRLLTPSWMPFDTPQHTNAHRRRSMLKARLAGAYSGQEYLPLIVPVLEPTVPLGVANITGGGLTVG